MLENVKKMVSSYYEGRQIQTPRHFFLNTEAFRSKRRGIFKKRLRLFYCNSRFTLLYMHRSIHSNAFKLVNTSFYSLSNKNETLKDWNNVKKMCFSIHFFIFSLKKIGYILKIHKFAPSMIQLSVWILEKMGSEVS